MTVETLGGGQFSRVLSQHVPIVARQGVLRGGRGRSVASPLCILPPPPYRDAQGHRTFITPPPSPNRSSMGNGWGWTCGALTCVLAEDNYLNANARGDSNKTEGGNVSVE